MALIRRIVIVGTGSIGRRHARLLAARKDLAVEFCEPNPEILALAREEVGDMPTHDSFEAVLASQPELVLIATPHTLHAEQTVAALEAGAHVLCEKPMSDRLETSAQMKAAAERTGKTLVFGFNLHFHPATRRLKKLIDSGKLGTVLCAHCHVGTYITLVNSRSRHQAKVEGALLLDYAHQPDLLYWLLGRRPTGVYAAGGQGGSLELQSKPNFITLTFDYDVPMVASIHLNYLQSPERHYYEIAGDRAWALFDLVGNRVCIGKHGEVEFHEERFVMERDDMYIAEHQAFFDTVDGKAPPESSPQSAIQAMEVFEASLTSWRQKRRVELDEVT